MGNTDGAFGRALISGTAAGLAVAAAASLMGKRDSGSYAAPINATSHVVWGEDAACQEDASLKYTVPGFLLNHASAIFWAAFYEYFFGGDKSRPEKSDQFLRPVIGAAAVTAGAYVTDYYLVPKRLTPGFEKRMSGKSLAVVYGALALGLAATGLARATRATSS